MVKKIFVFFSAVFLGFVVGYFGPKNIGSILPKNETVNKILSPIGAERRQIIGFLPYWLVASADKDYTKYLTTLAYFGLTIEEDGTIRVYSNPNEAEPGRYALFHSEKVNNLLKDARNKNIDLSLVVFSSDEENIGQLIEDPQKHAKTLVAEVAPIMKEYGFSDLNLDIESVLMASDSARVNFTAFVSSVRAEMNKKNLGTLTIDVSPIVLFKKYLVDVPSIAEFVDRIVFMTYDYHYFGSSVTGPVAPIGGAGVEAEFDVEVSVKEAVNILPLNKIILGVPLYGYEWETLSDIPRSATLPSSGMVASNSRVEEYLASCKNCEIKKDGKAKESYLIYKDDKIDTYHQIFFPDKSATEAKIKLAKKYNLGGVALWALGYEGDTILDPLLLFR